jgi:hypothetical protein
MNSDFYSIASKYDINLNYDLHTIARRIQRNVALATRHISQEVKRKFHECIGYGMC